MARVWEDLTEQQHAAINWQVEDALRLQLQQDFAEGKPARSNKETDTYRENLKASLVSSGDLDGLVASYQAALTGKFGVGSKAGRLIE